MENIDKDNMTSKQKANEFRRTHFTLGNYQSNPFKTEMKSQFHDQEDKAVQANKKTNFQGTHFKLGNSENQFRTSNLAHYKDKSDQHELTKLTQDKIDDLRSTHICYGNYGKQHLTEQNLKYGLKEPQESLKEKQEQQKQKMRKHHHDFKEDQGNRFSSQYAHQYQNKEAAPNNVFQERMVINQQNQKEFKTKSHILLGQQFLSKHTIQQTDYQEKEQPVQQKCNINQTQTHYALGENRNDFQTINSIYYQPQKGEPHRLTEEQIKRLGQSHFGLGADKNYRMTENMAQFYQKKDDKETYQQQTQNKNKSHQNHVQLGKDKATYQSNYKKNMMDYTEEILNGDKTAPIMGESKINIGNIPNDYKSENVKQFGYDKEKLVENKIDPMRKQQIQMSHLKFNDITNNQFKTTQGRSYQQRPNNPNNLSEDQMANLVSTHFKLGNYHQKKQTDYQREFCNENNQRISMPVNYKANKSNWKLG